MTTPTPGRVSSQEVVEAALRKHILQPDDSTWYAVTARSVLAALREAGFYLIHDDD